MIKIIKRLFLGLLRFLFFGKILRDKNKRYRIEEISQEEDIFKKIGLFYLIIKFLSLPFKLSNDENVKIFQHIKWLNSDFRLFDNFGMTYYDFYNNIQIIGKIIFRIFIIISCFPLFIKIILFIMNYFKFFKENLILIILHVLFYISILLFFLFFTIFILINLKTHKILKKGKRGNLNGINFIISHLIHEQHSDKIQNEKLFLLKKKEFFKLEFNIVKSIKTWLYSWKHYLISILFLWLNFIFISIDINYIFFI